MFKSALMIATAAAIALSPFDLRAAQAAPQSGPAIVKSHAGVDEVSAARKKRRYGYRRGGGFPLAAFGMIAGTIGAIAAAERRSQGYPAYYEDDAPYGAPVYGAPVYGSPYGYEEPQPVYGYGYGGYAPRRVYAPGPAYAPRAYVPNVYQGARGFQGRPAGGSPRQFVQRGFAGPQGGAARGQGAAGAHRTH